MIKLNGYDNKTLGDETELRFQLTAYLNNYVVSKPFGDNCKYDFILDNGHGKLYKIQVRAIGIRDRAGVNGTYKMSATCTGSKRPFEENEIDFFACYIKPEETWYIIPLSATRGKKVALLFPHRDMTNGRGLYEQYKNNWNCF